MVNAEVLLEIGTRVRVSDKHAEIKSSKAKCVALEVISTEISLVDEVKRFSEFCKDQEDDQAKDTAVDTVLPQEIKVINPVPAEEYDEAKVRDNKLSTEAKYQGLKVCLRCTDTKILGPMLKALKKLVDDQYCDGVNMIKMYQLTQEDFGAIFASTFCYEDPKCSRKCVADALNEALLEQSKIKDCWYLYLMHLINGLRKLPTCTDSSTTYYACVPKDWSPSCGKEYVMPGFSIGYTDREEALKMAHSSGGVNYNVIEFPGKGVKAYNIAPLSAGLRDCTVIIEPFFHFKVVSLSNEDTTCVEQSQENSLLEEALLKCLTRFKGEAPLPKGWEIQVDEATGKEYYVNTETDQTQWNKPEIISPHFYSPNVDEWKKSHKPSGSRDILRIGTRVGATSALAASMDSSSAEVPFGTCLTRSMPEIPIEDDSEIPLGGSSETPIESNSEIPLGGDPKDSETSLEDNPEIPLGTVGVPAKVPKAVPPPTMPTTSTFQTNAVAPPRYENRNRLSTAVSLSTTKKQDTRQNRKTKNIYGLSQSHQPQTSKTMPLPQGQCWQASTYAPTQNQYKQQSFSQISQYPPQYQQCNNSFQSQPKWNYQPQFNQKTQLLGMNWVTMQDSMTGRFYYANTVTKETSWTMPQRWN